MDSEPEVVACEEHGSFVTAGRRGAKAHDRTRDTNLRLPRLRSLEGAWLMPMTDTDCPRCGVPLHSDELWFGERTECTLGCGADVTEEIG